EPDEPAAALRGDDDGSGLPDLRPVALAAIAAGDAFRGLWIRLGGALLLREEQPGYVVLPGVVVDRGLQDGCGDYQGRLSRGRRRLKPVGELNHAWRPEGRRYDSAPPLSSE